MNFDPKDHQSALDEIMAKINEIQQEAQMIESSKKLIEDCEQETENKSPSASPVDESIFDQIMNEKKITEQPKEKTAIRRFIDGDEDENEEDEQPQFTALYEDQPEDIEDFEKAEDKDEIYRDLKNTVGKMAVKMSFLFLLCLVSLYLFVAGFQPVLFANKIDSIWFKITFLAIDVLSVVVSAGIFAEGARKLLHARADTDTLLAVLWLSITVVRIVGVIKPDLLPHALNFEPMLTFGLWFNVMAKKKIASNIMRNFKRVAVSSDKLTVTVPPSCETNNELILETGEGGEVMYAHHTALVSRYIEHSYSDYEWDRKMERLFFLNIVAVLVSTIAISQLAGIGAAILFPAAAFSISVPFFSRYYYASSIAKNGKKNRKNGGILTSARSAKKLEDADLMIISEEDFLGKDAVLLQGVKAMGEMNIDDLITNIAALFSNVGTPLKPLFLKMIDSNTVSLPRVDDIYYHTGMGYTCLIHSKMFLVGNAKLMEKFNIDFPKPLLEMQLKKGRYPVYVAYQKHPAGIFITSYEHNSNTEKAIRLTEEEQVSIGLVSNDFLFDKKLFNSLYPTSHPELFHFISSKTGTSCKPFLTRCEKSDDLIASVSGIRGLISSLYSASKLLLALKINGIIRILYMILSLLLIFFIALAGYSANTALQILAFQAIWMVPICAVCTFCK